MYEGGKGANQASAAARLGGKVTMVGQVGPDAFGARLTDALAAVGVNTSGIGVSRRATGSASISVLPGGENAIVVSPGANACLSPDIAIERLQAAAPYHFLLGQLETPLPAVIAAFAEARRLNATTILDPAPVQSLPDQLIADIDFVTPNQVEAAALLGGDCDPPRTFEDARIVAGRLLRAGYRGIVLKLGPLGCYIATAALAKEVPGFEVEAVDTTAAGDTFNAAFAVALAEGATPLNAAVFANAAAALSVTQSGAQNSIPGRAQVESFLASRNIGICSR